MPLKENPRPIAQHRSSFGSGQATASRSSLPRSYSGAHQPPSSSSSLALLNPPNRVVRRKSSSLTPAAINAAAQALGEGDVRGSIRRSAQSRIALSSLAGYRYPSPPNSLPQSSSMPRSDSAVVDGPSLASITEKSFTKDRIRRASDGSTLSSKKKDKGAPGDLKCTTCGKGYKHSSCLTKHLWEHTPEWAITSKLLISKHQQVQLLEAASVLVAMNGDGSEAAKSSDSDMSYPSNSSEREDSVSSIETTPPPPGEYTYGGMKRQSTNSSTFSRSYNSAVFSPAEQTFPHRRQPSTNSSNRPGTAQTAMTEEYSDQDQADLAAAVGLLSCSHATPQTGPTHLTLAVPPVPPLPEKYQSPDSNDVDMAEPLSSSEDDRPMRARNSRHEEYGMFNMEQ